MALTTELTTRLVATYTGVAGLATPTAPLDVLSRIRLASGTGANQADRVYYATPTLAASGTANLDLAGSLTDPLGAALTFARIKLVYVAAAAGNTNNVNVTQPASNGVPLFLAAGDGIAVRPGGMFQWACTDATGVPVTASTGDLLTFANSGAGTPVTYDVIIIGAS